MRPHLWRLVLIFCLGLLFQEAECQSDAPSSVPSDVQSSVPTRAPTLSTSTPSSPPVLVTVTPSDYPSQSPSDTPSTVPTVPFPCYRNLTDVNEDVQKVNSTIGKQYVLCPHTIYDIGDFDPTLNTWSNGMAALYARSNVNYICGESGAVENNCTLTGGEFQVINDFFVFDSSAQNAGFRGITFEKARKSSLFLRNAGNIFFENCVFQDMLNVIPVDANWAGTGRQRVIFEKSAFANNRHMSNSVGIITAQRSTDIELSGCIFLDNFFGSGVDIRLNSNVIIYNSCFINNVFVDIGSVQVLSLESTYQSSMNFVNNNPSSGLTCPYLAYTEVQTNGVPRTRCLNYEVTTCQGSIPRTDVPTVAPTPRLVPPPAPTAAPTASPTSAASRSLGQLISLAFTAVLCLQLGPW